MPISASAEPEQIPTSVEITTHAANEKRPIAKSYHGLAAPGAGARKSFDSRTQIVSFDWRSVTRLIESGTVTV